MHRWKKGFSLIELLVVIAIIGILSGIISVNLSSARQGARDAERIADIKNIQLSLALYYNDNLRYPCDIYTNPGGAGCPNFLDVYMSGVPRDPSTNALYKYAAINPSGVSCTGATQYHIGAVLEVSGNTVLTSDADAANATQCNTSPTNFHGNSPTCSAGSGSPDQCYDLTNFSSN